MKPTLLFATLTMIFASPALSAKSELELLRARCAEQERQIQQLEQENTNLRADKPASRSLGSQTEQVSTPSPKSAEVAKTTEAPKVSTPSGSLTYTVKKGDSIERIARKVGTSPVNLAKMNGLKSSAVIHPGDTLKVPENSVTAAKPVERPATDTAKPPVATASVAPGRTYKIRGNDTFYSISKKEKVSIATLIAANPKVKPTALRAGQVINLGHPKSSAPTQTVAKAPASAAPAVTPAKPATQQAQASTVSVLAEKSPVTHTAPAPTMTPAASSAPAPAPVTNTPTTAATTPSAPATPAAAPAAAETSSPTPEKKIRPITIDGEMTYGEFAAQHGTNPERLNALNGLDLNTTTVLAKGSELYVPAQP